MGFTDGHFDSLARARNRELAEARASHQPGLQDRAARVAQEQATRLGVPTPIDPVSSPESAADWIESTYGTEQDVPSYWNSDEYAAAVRDRRAAGVPDTESFYTMAPERYRYMQDVGRAVDLLRGLREPTKTLRSPEDVALEFWDKSDGARSTRSDYHRPNYQRYSGSDNATPALFGSSTSPVSAHVRNVGVPTNAIAFTSVGGGLQDAGVLHGLEGRIQLGEVPVAAMPSPTSPSPADAPSRSRLIGGSTPELEAAQRSERWRSGMDELEQVRRDIGRPGDQYMTQALFGGPVPRFTADIVGTAASMIDPSFWVGLAAAAPRAAAAKMSVLRNLLAEAASEGAGEAAFTGALNSLIGTGEGSLYDYVFTPVSAAGYRNGKLMDDPKRRDRAQAKAEALINSEPRTIWEKVHGESPVWRGAEAVGRGIYASPQAWGAAPPMSR
jgi:hypothetical protein